MTKDVLNANQLSQRFKVAHSTVIDVLRRAKIEGLYSTPYGKGKAVWFDGELAGHAIKSYLAAEAAKISTKAPAVPEAGLALGDTLKGLQGTLKVLDAAVVELSGTVTAARAEMKRLEDQNRTLASMLNKQGEMIAELHRELTTKAEA